MLPLPESSKCPYCPDGHRRPGSKPMTVSVGRERDSDGQPTTLHVSYAAGHHVSEIEADWLRGLLTETLASVGDLLHGLLNDPVVVLGNHRREIRRIRDDLRASER